MFEENYKNLKSNIIRNDKIVFSNKNSKLIPINTKSNEEVFKEGSFRIIGELSRLLCNKQITSDLNDLKLINDDIWVAEEDSDDRYYLETLFEDYLSKNMLHPKLLLQIPLSKNDEMRRSEQSIAKFLHDIIFKDLEGINEFFNDNISFQSNFIITHIMQNLEETEYTGGNRDEFLYSRTMKNVVDVIRKDFQFAFKEQKFLLKNFEKMVSYYLFFYFSQFLLKTSTTQCSQDLEETYYLLDWESASSGRDSIDLGYNRVQNYFDLLKIKMDVIEHLNLLLGEKNMLVPEIREHCSKMDEDTQKNFKHYLSLWIKKLRELEGLDEGSLSLDINGLIKDLEDSIKEAYVVNAKRRSGTVNRYRQVIKCLAETYFIKRRGPHGYVFNIDLELLLVITRLCIGDKENISFNHLIEEYRNRGLFFDKDSQKMILTEFEKLNLIDKKSDSEEVQYVRLFL